MARLDTKKVNTRAGAPSKQPESVLEGMIGGTPGVPKALKGVLFGPPKTKKTTAACTGGRTLLINFDPEGYAVDTLKGRTDIDIVEPTSLIETQKITTALISGEGEGYDFVVLDSITFMFQRFGGKDILDTYIKGKDVRRAYGQAGAACCQIINDLALLPTTNVIFVAHLKKEYSEDDLTVDVDQDLGEHEVTLAVTPMVWSLLGPAVGFIGRTFKADQVDLDEGNTETKFFVSFNDGSRSPAGSRYKMAGRYEITDNLLRDLANELL